MKRIYITLGVLLIGMIAMAYLYFSNLTIETSANDLSLTAASADASLVFSFENDKSFYEILSGQDLFQEVLGETKSKQLKALRDNLVGLPALDQALGGQKIYIGVLPGAATEIDFLISTQLKANADPQKILKLLQKKQIALTPTNNVYQLTFSDGSTCYFTVKDQLVAISNAIKPVINLADRQKLADEKFVNYIKTNSRGTKNTLANLYINFNQFPALLKNILNSNLTGELNVFNKQNSYAAFSYNFSREKLLFNGTTDLNNLNSYEQLFANIAPQDLTIANILPQSTANYAIYNINSYENWHKKLTEWFVQQKENKQIDQQINVIDQKYRLALKQTLVSYFKNQFVTFQLNTGEKFGAVALKNGEKVNQFLMDLSSDYAPEVKIFKESNLAYAFFGTPFKKFERPFYTIIDNYLVMANHASSIQVFLSKYRNGELLINNADYMALRDQLSTQATIVYYVNNKNSNDIFGRNLKSTYYKQYQSKSGFKDYDAFSYQLSGDNGKFLSNLLLFKKQKTIPTDSLSANP